MNAQHKGFTLVELIVVIVILGILAATALPRFVNIQGDARAASMKGVAGSMRGAAELVRGKYLAVGSSGAGNLTVDTGVVVAVTSNGYPTATAAGIVAAMTSGASTQYDFQHAGGTTTVRPSGGTPAACQVTYAEGTGAVTDTAATAANCQ